MGEPIKNTPAWHASSGALTVLKLGGALLTDKWQPDSLRADTLAQVAAEIGACLNAGLLERLILVTGVGSFGHPLVLRHRLHQGFCAPEQLLALSQTQINVMALRSRVAEALAGAGVPVCLMLPSSCMTAVNFCHKSSYLEGVAGFLRLGMVPMLGGDVLADEQTGFMVYGGDEIAVDMAQQFGAARLIFATQVDGVYERDPQQEPTARRLPLLALNESSLTAVTLEQSPQIDVSGAMAGKLRALRRIIPLIASGLEVHLLSMMRPGHLTAVLRGETAVGTRIIAGF